MRIKRIIWLIFFNSAFLFSLASHAGEQYLDFWFNEFVLKINNHWKVEVLRRDDKRCMGSSL